MLWNRANSQNTGWQYNFTDAKKFIMYQMDNYNFSKPRDKDVVVRKVKDWNMYKFLNHRLEVKLPGMRFIFFSFLCFSYHCLTSRTYVTWQSLMSAQENARSSAKPKRRERHSVAAGVEFTPVPPNKQSVMFPVLTTPGKHSPSVSSPRRAAWGMERVWGIWDDVTLILIEFYRYQTPKSCPNRTLDVCIITVWQKVRSGITAKLKLE